jgi:hypothetical protein
MPKVLGVIDGSITGGDTLEKQQNLWVRKKDRRLVYQVLGDTLGQTEDDILLATGIPTLFYPLNGCWCKSRKCKEVCTVRHPTTGVLAALWEVDCEFSSDVDQNQNTDPESKRPTVEWTSEFEDEVLEKDVITGNAIQTDADEPIVIENPVTVPILEITRYQAWPFDPDVILNYVNHTNETVFWGAPKGAAYMAAINTSEEMLTLPNNSQQLFVKATFRIKFKIKKDNAGTMQEDTWLARPLHQGYKYRKVAGGIPEIYLDKQGNPATVNLQNGTGLKLGPLDPAEYLEFNRFHRVNFNNLSLGPF